LDVAKARAWGIDWDGDWGFGADLTRLKTDSVVVAAAAAAAAAAAQIAAAASMAP